MANDAKRKAEMLRGPLSKIEWAKQHVAHLAGQISVYLLATPFELRVSQSQDPRERTVYVKTKIPIPDHFPLVIGDAVHNLRTALDHLCWDMVGDKAKTKASVGFPFAKAGGDSLTSTISTRQMHLAPEEVIKEIHNLKPYPGGNEFLNAVKVLDEGDKHRSVLLVGNAIMFTVAQVGLLIGKENVAHLPQGMVVTTVGDFVVHLAGDDPIEVFDKEADFQPAFTIGFPQEEELGPRPVLIALREMVRATEDAVRRLARAYFA